MISDVIFDEAIKASVARHKMITNSDIDEHYEYCIFVEPNLYKQAYDWCVEKYGESRTSYHSSESDLKRIALAKARENTIYHWSTRRWFTSGSWNDNLYYYHFYFKTSEDTVQFALRWK